MTDLNEFAEKNWDWDMNKAVPLHLLLAWLSQNTDHGGHAATVPHGALEKWAKEVAVTRVIDHGPYGADKEVWNFFEYGWHKSGCEGRLAQARARIGDPAPEGTVLFSGPAAPPKTMDEDLERRLRNGVEWPDITKQVEAGFTTGYSIGNLDVEELTNTETKED